MINHFLSTTFWSGWLYYSSRDWKKAAETLEYELLFQSKINAKTFNRLLYCYENLEEWEKITDYLHIIDGIDLYYNPKFKIVADINLIFNKQKAATHEIKDYVGTINIPDDKDIQQSIHEYIIDFYIENNMSADIAEYIATKCSAENWLYYLDYFFDSLLEHNVNYNIDKVNDINIIPDCLKNKYIFSLAKYCIKRGKLNKSLAIADLLSDSDPKSKEEIIFINDCENGNYVNILNKSATFSDKQIRDNPLLLNSIAKLYYFTGNIDNVLSLLEKNKDYITRDSIIWFIEYYNKIYGFKNIDYINNENFIRIKSIIHNVSYINGSSRRNRVYIVLDDAGKRKYYKKMLEGDIIFVNHFKFYYLLFFPELIVEKILNYIKEDQEIVFIGCKGFGFDAIFLALLLASRCERDIKVLAIYPYISLFPYLPETEKMDDDYELLISLSSKSNFVRSSLEKYGNLFQLINRLDIKRNVNIFIIAKEDQAGDREIAKLNDLDFVNITYASDTNQSDVCLDEATDSLILNSIDSFFDQAKSVSHYPAKKSAPRAHKPAMSAVIQEGMRSPNEIAIITAINNAYVPMLAVMLLSLKKNSYKVYINSDFIIFHDDVTISNQKLLKKIFPNIRFINIITEANIPSEILAGAKRLRYGVHVLDKLCFYNLLYAYKHVLHIDADMIVTKKLDDLFIDSEYDIKYPMSTMNVMQGLFNEKYSNSTVTTPNGGFIYFNHNILKRNLPDDFLLDSYNMIKNITKLGIDERILGYVTHKYQLKLQYISHDYNITIDKFNDASTRVLHFMHSAFKPWKNPDIWVAASEWGSLYKEWLIISEQKNSLIDQGQNDLYNSNVLFHTLYNYKFFIHIFNCLTKENIPGLSSSFNPDGRYLIIHIQHLPEYVHYEVSRSRLVTIIGLHVEDSAYITPGIIALFRDIENELKEKFPAIKLALAKTIKIDIPVPENYAEFHLKFFINSTITKIKNYFKL